MIKILNKKLNNFLNESFLDSFILINKSSGRTSHDEVFTLKKFLKIKKVGHSGTLDPKVTGLLVCGSGRVTKLLEYLLLSSKAYIAIFEFHKKIEKDVFEKNLKNFLGKIKQLPPVKSAVKRQLREREVYDIKILNYDKNLRWAKLYIEVERGTYIRKLAHDMGQKIGINISMGNLERVKVGIFNQKDIWITTDELGKLFKKFRNSLIFKLFYFFKIKKYFLRPEVLFHREKKFQILYLKKEAVSYVKNGARVRLKNIKKTEFDYHKIPVCFYRRELICIGEWIKTENNGGEDEIIKLKKVFN